MNEATIVNQLFAHTMRLADDIPALLKHLADVQGRFSWWFLEHSEELDADRLASLVKALIRRRALKEGIITGLPALSSQEEKEVSELLAHNNSLHERRARESSFLSLREETFRACISPGDFASPKEIRAALLQGIETTVPKPSLKRDSKRELVWMCRVGRLDLVGRADFSDSNEQISTFVVLKDRGRPVHSAISLLQTLGIGTTCWDFLLKGEESVCARSILDFYSSVHRLLSDLE